MNISEWIIDELGSHDQDGFDELLEGYAGRGPGSGARALGRLIAEAKVCRRKRKAVPAGPVRTVGRLDIRRRALRSAIAEGDIFISRKQERRDTATWWW